MKRGILLLLVIIGVFNFFIPSLQAGDPLPSAQRDCPSCSSFGIQRFTEKKEPPPFSLKGLDGNTFALNEFRGKPVLLMFWASWCPACKEDIASLERFSEKRKDQLVMFTIAIDGEKEKRVQRIVKKNRITLPVLLDLKEKVARSYGVRMVPTTFLIDGEGLMIGMIVGQRDWSSPEAWSAIRELFSLR